MVGRGKFEMGNMGLATAVARIVMSARICPNLLILKNILP
jgi:hypothetical protein